MYRKSHLGFQNHQYQSYFFYRYLSHFYTLYLLKKTRLRRQTSAGFSLSLIPLFFKLPYDTQATNTRYNLKKGYCVSVEPAQPLLKTPGATKCNREGIHQ